MSDNTSKPNPEMVDQPEKFHDEFPDRIAIYEKEHPIMSRILRGKKKKKKKKKKK